MILISNFLSDNPGILQEGILQRNLSGRVISQYLFSKNCFKCFPSGNVFFEDGGLCEGVGSHEKQEPKQKQFPEITFCQSGAQF